MAYDDPLRHHVYMALWTDRSREDIASLFEKSGWSSRKCTWIDYEVALEDQAELVIESENPILAHGPIASATETTLTIRKILDDAGVAHSFEAHDEQDRIVIEVTQDELNSRGR